MNLGNKLLELRKQKGLSQEDVAFELNVTRQTISKWETNQTTPDFDKIAPLCKLYEISTDELLTGKKLEKTLDEDKKITNKEYKKIIDQKLASHFIEIKESIEFDENENVEEQLNNEHELYEGEKTNDKYELINGNVIGALFAYYLLENKKNLKDKGINPDKH